MGSTLLTGLIGYWKFDENTGTTAYDSQGTYNGTISGAAINQAGIINTAYSFDGTNDYVDLGFNRQSVPISFSMWVKASIKSNWQTLISNDSGTPSQAFGIRTYGHLVLFKGKNDIVINVGNLEIDVNSSFDSGIWHHIALTINTNSVNCYVNGINVYSTTSYGTTSNQTGTFRVGLGHSYYYKGLIDELGIWEKELTVSEIKKLYMGGAGNAYPFEAGTPLKYHNGSTWVEKPVRYHDGTQWKSAEVIKRHNGSTWVDV